MATQTMTTADAILKDLYVGPIIEQLNYKSYMIDQIERESNFTQDHTGRRAIVPVHTGRNRGRGSRGDGGTLPTAGQLDLPGQRPTRSRLPRSESSTATS